MRLVRVLVPAERREEALAALDEGEYDFVVIEGAGRSGDESVLEVPISDEGVGDVTESLSDAGVDLDRYTVVEEAEWIATPRAEEIRERYAETYDRPSREELRSLADKLNWDVRSFVAMMALSAVIASIGLIIDSPVVVVGSAVIAPLVNPMLITGIGTVLGQRRMIRDSLRLQALGLLVAAVCAFGVGLAVDALGLAPSTLSMPTLDMVQTRLAPSALAVLVGVGAGAAATVSLTAESSLINIVGVMVAAALIPAAAATGIALAWGYPLIALGSAFLLVATVVAVDVAVFLTFVLLGYRPSGDLLSVPSRGAALRVAAAVLAIGAVLVSTGVATAGQAAFERDVNRAVDDVVAEHEGAETAAVRSEYADYSPFTGPETIIVEVGRTDGASLVDLPDLLADRIAAETGRAVDVRVEFENHRESS